MLERTDIDAIARAVADLVQPPRRKLLRADEVAAMLDVSTDFVYEHGTELGAVRLGHGRGAVRFVPADVDAYIERQRVTPKRQRRRPGPVARSRPATFELIPLPEGL